MKPELATALSNQGGQLDVLTITTASDAFNLLPASQRGLHRHRPARPRPSEARVEPAVELPARRSRSDATARHGRRITGRADRDGDERPTAGRRSRFTKPADGPDATRSQCVPSARANRRRSHVRGQRAAVHDDHGLRPGAHTFRQSRGSTFQCAGRRRAHTRRPDDARFESVSTTGRRRHDDDRAAAPTRRGTSTTPAPRSRSRRTRRARRSSARSTAPRSAPARSATPGLAQGAHTFQVRATDAAGNIDATPARAPGPSTPSRRRTIAPAAGATNDTSATFTFTANEPARRSSAALDGAALRRLPRRRYTGRSRRAPHVRGPRDRRRRQPTRSPAARSWTSTPSPRTPRSRPDRRDERNTPTFTFTLQGGRDVPVPRRRRRVRGVHSPQLHRRSPHGVAHVPGPRDRRRRATPTLAGLAHLDRRHASRPRRRSSLRRPRTSCSTSGRSTSPARRSPTPPSS